MKKLFSCLVIVCCFVIASCDDSKTVKSKKSSCAITLDKVKVVEGDTINFKVKSKGSDVQSQEFLLDGNPMVNEASMVVNNLAMGRHRIDVLSILEDGTECKKYNFFEVVSSILPVDKKCKVLTSYDHDDMSYTQGLEFHDGLMYEGTGQYGYSFLHKFSLLDNKSMLRKDLSEDYFGEGITVFKDKIYQITYHAQTAFVYDKQSLEKITELSYVGDGWGLTHNNEHIIMSNGSNKISFRDAETFEVVREIEVYDNNGKVINLNELEYVDGLIYANIYQTDLIVAIDATTGAVVERINCKGLLDPKDIKSRIDVFNGIAYNENTKTFYVTGKFWPKLYEVVFE